MNGDQRQRNHANPDRNGDFRALLKPGLLDLDDIAVRDSQCLTGTALGESKVVLIAAADVTLDLLAIPQFDLCPGLFANAKLGNLCLNPFDGISFVLNRSLRQRLAGS